LNIYSGTSLTIDAGKGLTVSGTLTNTPGISGLVVKSGGSLIQSTGSVAATVERTITGWNNYPGNEATHGWHLLSSPTTAQTIQNEFVPAVYTANEDFYAWWETTNQWVNFKNTTTPPTWNTANVLKVGGSTVSGGTNFIPAKGYLVAYASDPTKQFTVGSLNTGDYAISELGISTGANYGWHLLGNPFPSALSWGTAGWLLSNIQATAKIWKESTAGYIDIQYGGPNEIIPALNGFMVEVSSGSGSLTIPAAARVHNGSAWYKSTDNPVVLLLASDPAGQTAQESVIRFEPGATGGFDPAFDAHFLAGYAPRFYSVSGDEHLSTNALPEMGGSVQIPFDFIKTDGVNFTIEAKMISGIWGPVILNDLKTGANQDLTANPVYAFTSAAGDNPARFLINFNHVGIPETQKDHSFTVYASDNILFVVDNTGKNQGNVFVYNLIGQLIASAKLNGSSTCNLNLNVPTGYYLVRIVSPETTQTSKIFIR